MTDHICMKCGAGLMSDEIALHRKLFGIASKDFMCLDCQAEYLRVDRERLEKTIEMYHRSGTCMLFAKWDKNRNKKLQMTERWNLKDIVVKIRKIVYTLV